MEIKRFGQKVVILKNQEKFKSRGEERYLDQTCDRQRICSSQKGTIEVHSNIMIINKLRMQIHLQDTESDAETQKEVREEPKERKKSEWIKKELNKKKGSLRGRRAKKTQEGD